MGGHRVIKSKRTSLDRSNWTTRNVLATNVVYLRHLKKWSQEELAHKSGRSVSVISDIENANIGATVDAIDDIGYALGWSTSELTKDHGFVVTKKRVDSRQ